MPRPEFVDYVCDLLKPQGHIRVRAMFGGWGFYCDDLFFAIAIADTLYLKADAATRTTFLEAGQQPFTYVMRGAEQRMEYYTVPAEALEDSSELSHWARLALAAARRKRAGKKPAR